MKKLILTLLITVITISGTYAQNYIVGYTSVEYVLSLMPEMKGIEQEIQDYTTQLQKSLEKKSQAFQVELSNFQKNGDKLNEVERLSKQRELEGTQNNLLKMQQDSEVSLQNKQLDLLKPLYKKIEAKIKEIRKEKEYSMIINESVNGTSVIIDADKKYDVTDTLLKKLGITPPANK